MRYAHALWVFLVLSACSLLPSRPALPSIQITPLSSTTPSPSASTTPTAITPTLTPSPTPDPKFFRDDFDQTLAPGWSWVREDPQNWSLVALPGALQINVAGGSVVARTNPNLLLRPAPEGNFLIQTQITFRPTRNFQFAGLIIYENDSNFIQAGRSVCNSFDCIGVGLYMNYYENGLPVEPDFAQRYGEIDPLLLRLSRDENTYTFEASTNGKVWFIIGSHTSTMNPTQVGLVAGQRVRGENIPATFEYFEVRGLP